MSTFLQSVAHDIVAKHPEGLAHVAIIFPNKRASLFFNHALYEVTRKTMWTPAYLTISDLFRSLSKEQVPDQNELIFRLYDLYQQVMANGETLDDFYSWGQLMLSDFDDIDKHCANAKDIFVNLANWQEMGDYSFLSEEQRESLREYFGQNLNTDSLGSKFNDLWQHLLTIYTGYREALRAEGKAYEGMLYRDVVENKQAMTLRYDHYIFVGFNLVQEVERRLFDAIKQQRHVSFYWNYDHYYLNPRSDKKDIEAGKHIAAALSRYPNELSPDRIWKRPIPSGPDRTPVTLDHERIYDQMSKPKDITYISAPTENIQARYVAEWLTLPRIAAGRRTAIVLGNEHLLEQVVHCLPKEVDHVNITTGFPLASSPAATLVNALLALQLYGMTGAESYRAKFVLPVLRHPYARLLSPQCATLADALANRHIYYPTRAQLTDMLLPAQADEAITLLFSPQPPEQWLTWVAELLERIAIQARQEENNKQRGDTRHKDDVFLQESLYRMYTLICRLNDLMVPVTQQTDDSSATGTDGQGRHLVSTAILQRLLQQIVQATTIPFHGEPLLGIQIMGVLETRNLDFDHLLVLSCEEGNMPKGINDASFIPQFMRRAHGLTTMDHKVAIYSYYFHAMIQRAADVTLTYNNATEDGQKHEMSRFMLQYMAENAGRQIIHRRKLLAGQNATHLCKRPIEKDERVVSRMMEIHRLSPSAINRYLRCPLQFYYSSVCQLQENDNDDDEEVNAQDFGNIFHSTAELIYKELADYDEQSRQYRRTVCAADIEQLLKDDARLDRFLDRAFADKLFRQMDLSRRPKYNGQQLLNREVIREYIKHLLHFDIRSREITFKGLELDVSDKLTFPIKMQGNETQKEIELFGQIDRLDLIRDAEGKKLVRVVDYKTGRPVATKPTSVAELFDPQYVDTRHTTYYLQAFLYASIIRHGTAPQHHSPCSAQTLYNKENHPVAPALYFIREANADDYNPILQLNVTKEYEETNEDKKTHEIKTEKKTRKEPVLISDIDIDIEGCNVYEEFRQHLTALLSEIFDASRPFEPTKDDRRCATCPYATLCGL